MKPEVRDAINNINRFIQETKFIDVSSNLKVEENVVARNLQGKEDDVVAEVMENLELIFKEISKSWYCWRNTRSFCNSKNN